MLKYVAVLSPLLLAGACSGSDEPEGPIEAGRWQIIKEVVESNDLDQPPELVSAMADEMNTRTVCLSEEEAANPTDKIFGTGDLIHCEYPDLTLAEGQLSAHGNCTVENVGNVGKYSVDGTYTATSFEAEWNAEREVEGETRVMRGAITAKKTGVC